jgi:hypothetical protein
MSIGGRRELVKTVLSSLLTYLLTPLKPPKKFYKDMDKMQRKFLGAGNKQLHGGKCKTAWPRICRPLNRSGLGIADLECFGRSRDGFGISEHHQKKPCCGTDLPIDVVDEASTSCR